MKTNDDLKIVNTEKNEFFEKISEKNIQKTIQKFKIFNIILILLNILFIIGIGVLVYFLLKSNKKIISAQEEKDEKKDLSFNNISKYNNTIIGTYFIKSGQKFQIFNPEKMNLSEDDYYIEILDKNSNLRNLRIVSDVKGYYIPDESGEKSFKINFKIILE